MKPVHVYIISDTHLGGEPGFQMCPLEARRRLARFVHHLIRIAKEREEEFVTELVINGDLVDFLAEREFQAFTRPPGNAVRKLQNILTHVDDGAPQDEQVFGALQAWVAEGHELTILLGNHDIELCLPGVRQALLDLLTGGKPARVQFLFDGEAYFRGALLVEHGNRYDGWNAVPYGALRAYRSAASRGEPAKRFLPMPGSRMVTDIMNPLKGRYRFIDLLKPENEALIPILSALEPASVKELRKIVLLLRQSRAAQVKAGQVPEAETYIAEGGPRRLGAPGQSVVADGGQAEDAPDAGGGR
jgi:UDP-2,3-diacylglucosamine pyrophosphatase LpxH